jgi:hypothetical protein
VVCAESSINQQYGVIRARFCLLEMVECCCKIDAFIIETFLSTELTSLNLILILVPVVSQ